MQWFTSLLQEQIVRINLVVDNIVVTVIDTSAVRSRADCLRNILHVRNFCDDTQRPTSVALRHKMPAEIMSRSNSTKNLCHTNNQQINEKSSSSLNVTVLKYYTGLAELCICHSFCFLSRIIHKRVNVDLDPDVDQLLTFLIMET